MQVPPWMFEGSNGATAFVLAFVFVFQLAFLAASWVKIKPGAPYYETAPSFYRQMKPVIALTVGFGGFLLRFGGVWYQRHVENRGLPAPSAFVAVGCHVFGTTASIVGVLCWLRVTMPHFCGRRTWFLVVVAAAIVFILPALR